MGSSDVNRRRRPLLLLLVLACSLAVVTLMPAPTQAVADSTGLGLNDTTLGATDVTHSWRVTFSTWEGSEDMDRIELDYSDSNVSIEPDPPDSSFTVMKNKESVPVKNVSVTNDVVTLNVSGAQINASDVVGIESGPIFGNPTEWGDHTASIQFFGQSTNSTVGTGTFSVGTGVRGVVENENGVALEGVTVRAENTTEQGTTVTTQTDANGEYALELGSGTYDIAFETENYVNVTHLNNTIQPGEIATVDAKGGAALVGVSPVDSLTLSDTSPGAQNVTYTFDLKPRAPITDVSYFVVNLSMAGDAVFGNVSSENVTMEADNVTMPLLLDGGGGGIYDSIYSKTEDKLTIATSAPIGLNATSTVTITVDGITNPSVADRYPFLVELREDSEGSPGKFKSYGFDLFETRYFGEVLFEDGIDDSRETFGVSYDFDVPGEPMLVLTNPRTEAVHRQLVSQPGSTQVNATDVGGLQGGDELVAKLYASNDGANLLDTDTITVDSADPAGELALEPTDLAFSGVHLGDAETNVISVENTGNESLTIADVRIEGPDSDVFRVSDTSLALDAGERTDLLVRFSSERPGTYGATIVFEDDLGYQRATVPLEGSAIREVSPPSTGDDDEDDEEEQDGDEDDEEDESDEPAVETDSESTDDGATVESSVQNAKAGEQVTVEVPDPSEDQEFELDQVGLTPETDGNFDLSIETSSQPLGSTPDAKFAFDGTTSLGYLSVDASVEDDDIGETEFTFRVSEERLAEWESSPEDVAMYRYDEATDTWVEHDTAFVGRDDGDVLLQTTADGFSEWTAAAKRPSLDITDTEIDVEVATTEEDVTIQVFVTNTGGADGTYEAQLVANDEIVDREDATVPANRTVIVDFVRTFDEPDVYEVRVNDVQVGEIEITEDEDVSVNTSTPAEDSDDATDGSDDATDGSDDGSTGNETGEDGDDPGEDTDDDGGILDGFGPGFGVPGALVALVLGSALVARRRRTQ